MLAVLASADISNPNELKTALDGFEQFRTLASDAGDVFTRLSELTTTVQE